MGQHRGMDGFLSIGGAFTAQPNLKTGNAPAPGATSAVLLATTLAGVLFTGDTFTIAGEAGAPVHTITNGPYIAVGNSFGAVTFTTPIGAGGVLINTAVTVAASSMAQARMWGLNAQQDVMDGTVFGAKWKTKVGGLASGTGQGEAFLDYLGDLEQKALIDQILAATPATQIPGIVLGLVSSPTQQRQFYGAAILSGCSIQGADLSSLVTVRFNFEITGPVLPNWL